MMFILTIFWLPIINALSAESLMDIIMRVCPEDKGVCPFPTYGMWKGDEFIWNANAIKNAAESTFLSRLSRLSPELVPVIQGLFCCRTGNCLKNCKNAKMPNEIDLIKNFPENGKEILNLEYAPLNAHRVTVQQFLKDLADGHVSMDDLPAGIEDFFDFLDTHKNELHKLLSQKTETAF